MKTVSYAPTATLLHSAVDALHPWIEQTLGVPLDCTTTIETELPIESVFIGKMFSGVDIRREKERVKRPELPIAKWELPPGRRRLFSAEPHTVVSPDDFTKTSVWAVSPIDTPVALWFEALQHPVVFIPAPYVGFPHGRIEEIARLLVIRQTCVAETLTVLARLREKSGPGKRIEVVNGPNLSLAPTDGWAGLVLDSAVDRLVRADFDTFLARRAWFLNNNLPFRRGYLFYGPPGNGKTSVIRAMASQPQISPVTINWGDDQIGDATLTRLFEWAGEHAPSLVILEDLDRHFGADAAGHHMRKVTLSHLLNCLDGVANPEGVIVVATANDPASLDPAIMRRPGRFDRTVIFRDPDHDLRAKYLRAHVRSKLVDCELADVARLAEGFSYAQLREAHIMAGQFAFERSDDIRIEDLRRGVAEIAQTCTEAKRYKFRRALGFQTCTDVIAAQ